MLAAYRFGISRYQRPLQGLTRPLRVAQLSDLHLGFWIQKGSLEAWIRATNAEAPELVVITGDLTDSSRPHQVLPALPVLGQLLAPLGVWAVWGNHDYRFNGYRIKERVEGVPPPRTFLSAFDPPQKVPMYPPEALAARLQEVGVEVLRNRGVSLREDLFLAGVDDLWHGEPDVVAAFRGAPPQSARLLLAHNPDYLYQVAQAAQRPSFTLCGHTHGGQIVLGGYGPVFTSSQYGQKFAQGFVEDPVPAFVSRGLGVSSAPLRYRCDAELVIFEFVPL
ncbi:metallophosphoesterase [Meiothermus granaticius]|uniref:3',5'-cyclic adenosine monophosphate phosphodiesterase CpdA n=1 Tax=Meiothermus granaticius NBRC 107808 TaxID=1227551 RepID=A0A399FCI8_9DEIN|nr:metallophosphoesterase [Meiothermus granaticius]RIH93039.1 3',5'-cyclic adenosine monophosphate phosphodiesterase CpdA [Meiothermus granaticius NBRC 107808]GEM86686.1 putative metallophosphoesterase [Meiothermus granaticius NBRC 107808]